MLHYVNGVYFMKYSHVFSSLFATMFLISFSSISFALDENEMTIINHFQQSLDFTVGINPFVVPDFPENFTLVDLDQIKSKVLDIHRESYIRVKDNENHSAFFGVQVKNS